MKGYFGRDDISCTIHVPFPCGNNCEFCTSKDQYAEINKKNMSSIEDNINLSIMKVMENCPDVKVFCITGGEPFNDSKSAMFTMNLINTIRWFEKKYLHTMNEVKIYINTTLPKRWACTNFENFMDLYYDKVSGLSISRHAHDHAGDSKYFSVEVVDDDFIATMALRYPKRLRINCVCTEKESAIQAVKRWKDYTMAINKGYLKLNLREDYRGTNFSNIHKLTKEQEEKYGFLNLVDLGGCNVCHTYGTKYDFVSVHKGVEHTAIVNKRLGMVEINDIVISPDGTVQTDWGYNSPKCQMIINKSKNDEEKAEVENARKETKLMLFNQNFKYSEMFLTFKLNSILDDIMYSLYGTCECTYFIFRSNDKNDEYLLSFFFSNPESDDSKFSMLNFKKNGNFDFKTFSSQVSFKESEIEFLTLEQANDILRNQFKSARHKEKVQETKEEKELGKTPMKEVWKDTLREQYGCSTHMVAPHCGF